jgi:hypothetical protein
LRTHLKNIASIQTGIFAKPIVPGEIVYLQAKHFDENGLISATLHPDLKASNLTERHLLKHGDVLFAAKGTKNFATWYESKNQPAVASTSFFVIRLTVDIKITVLPEFLVWLLNHQVSQKYLKGRAIGTSIVSISKSVLGELEISIPDLQTQKAILKITKLSNERKRLKHQIDALKEKQIQQQILKAIK